jgi:2-phosphosulfolactate phosphatase
VINSNKEYLRNFGMNTRKNIMKFNCLSLSRVNEAQGSIVVIDVLRAFTTAAYAFNQGAEKIIPVATAHEAFELRNKIPGSLIIGEELGLTPKGFDLGNSPEEIINHDLSNKTLIQRTSAGTQGLVLSKAQTNLMTASFVVAKATAKFLRALNPEILSFIISGDSMGRDGDEDLACADYIAALIQNQNPDPDKFTSRILTSSVGRSYLSGGINYLSEKDIAMSSRVDLFDFVMAIRKEDDLLVMRLKAV